MTTTVAVQPIPTFLDVDGQPLDRGKLYFGTAGSSALLTTKTMYWDAALTQVAPRPVPTKDGYASNNGAIARLFTTGDYSIYVADRNDAHVTDALNSTQTYGGTITGPAVTVVGNIPTWADTTGNTLGAGYAPSAIPVIATGSTTARTLGTRFADMVSAKDYGVTANGSTDDTAAMQAAINAASNFKGVLALPAGIIKVSGTLTVSVAITIIGQGSGTIVSTTSATAPIFSISSVLDIPGVVIKGLDLSTSVTRTGGAYIVSSGANGTTIDGCKFVVPYNGVHVTGPSCSNLKISNCYMVNVVNDGILIDAGTDNGGPAMQGIVVSEISSTLVVGQAGTNAASGIRITSVGDLTIYNFSTVYCSYGMLIAPRSAAVSGLPFKETIQFLVVSESIFDSGNSAGISITGTGEKRNIVISDCWTATSGVHGVEITGAGDVFFVAINNLTSVNNVSSGLTVNAALARVVNVVGGCFAGNAGDGIFASSSTLNITGSHTGLTDPANVAFGPNGGYGINLAGNVNYSICNVNFGSNTSGNLSDASSGTKSIVASPGTGRTLYYTGAVSMYGPAGNNWRIGPIAATAHLAGNVCSAGLGIEDGGGGSGVFVHNTHNGTFSSQDVRVLTGEGGVSAATERMRVLPNGNIAMLTSGGGSFGGGVGACFLGNVETVPTVNPVGGGILYVNAGALTYRGPAGTVSVIAPA